MIIGGSAQGQQSTLIFSGGTGHQYITSSAATHCIEFQRVVKLVERSTAPTIGNETGMLQVFGATLKFYNGSTWIALH